MTMKNEVTFWTNEIERQKGIMKRKIVSKLLDQANKLFEDDNVTNDYFIAYKEALLWVKNMVQEL